MGKMLASCNCSQHLTILCLSTYHLSFYLSVYLEFGKFSVSHAPSHRTCRRVLRAFVSYALSCLTRRMCLTCASYLRAFFMCLRALFAPLKIFLEWISSLSKTLNFPKTTKGTIKCAFSCWSKNSHGIF